jgi:gamma-glutamyltranspeptidase/glutathione hydrolase
VASTLNVVEPYMSGIAGVGVMAISMKQSRERWVLDFMGPAPAAADPDAISEADLDGGVRSCLVPGNLAGWMTALERFGTMPRATVMENAIRLAEHGVPLTWKNCEYFQSAEGSRRHSAEARRIYPTKELRPGQLLVQKELARTLREIAAGGADAFYDGPVGRQICAAIEEAGGWLSARDLSMFAPEWRAPLTMPFRGLEIMTAPPPFVAFQYLETLNILDAYPMNSWGHNSIEYLHHLIEGIKLASTDRLAYGHEPDPPITGLLSQAYAISQRARITADRCAVSEGERFHPVSLPGQLLSGHPLDLGPEHTTHFACADGAGNVVNVTQTNGTVFGSGFVVNGVLLNNMLKWADFHPKSPNRILGGRKAGMMFSPTQIFRGTDFVMSIGTPGSYGILQTTPQIMLNVLQFGMNIQEAIEAPRIRVHRDRRVDAENRIDREVIAALIARGHQINVIEDWSSMVGGSQGIFRDLASGVLQGGADPRRDGYVIAI